MFGYDDSGVLIGASGPLVLTNFFQQLNANLAGTRFLEIRADADSKHFSIDNLDVTSNSVPAVPEPSSLAIFGIGAGIMGLVSIRRRRREQKRATA